MKSISHSQSGTGLGILAHFNSTSIAYLLNVALVVSMEGGEHGWPCMGFGD